MSEVAILAASIQAAMLEIAKQAGALGNGLQNAAPGEKARTPNNSVLYLLKISEALIKQAEECRQLQATFSQTNSQAK